MKAKIKKNKNEYPYSNFLIIFKENYMKKVLKISLKYINNEKYISIIYKVRKLI